MEADKIKNADYLDILFDKRNKKYGGYALRKQSGRRMIQALSIMLLLCAGFITTSMVSKKAPAAISNPIREREHYFTDIKPPTPPPQNIKPPIQEVQQKTAAKKRTKALTPPVVVRETKPTVEMPTIDSLSTADIGPTTQEGSSEGEINGNPNEEGTTPIEPPKPIAPLKFAEEMPEFVGNINSYLSKSIQYPANAIREDISGRVLVQFVIDEQGVVTNAKIARGIGGGCDEEALRVVNAMPKWKPGKQNGVAVKILLTLPIYFRLE